MSSLYDTTATIKRLAYVSSVGTYTVVSGVTLIGFFTPMDPEQNKNQLGAGMQGYKFYTDGGSTVYPSDKLTINSVDYQVRGVRRYNMRSLDFLDITLELAVRA